MEILEQLLITKLRAGQIYHPRGLMNNEAAYLAWKIERYIKCHRLIWADSPEAVIRNG